MTVTELLIQQSIEQLPTIADQKPALPGWWVKTWIVNGDKLTCRRAPIVAWATVIDQHGTGVRPLVPGDGVWLELAEGDRTHGPVSFEVDIEHDSEFADCRCAKPQILDHALCTRCAGVRRGPKAGQALVDIDAAITRLGDMVGLVVDVVANRDQAPVIVDINDDWPATAEPTLAPSSGYSARRWGPPPPFEALALAERAVAARPTIETLTDEGWRIAEHVASGVLDKADVVRRLVSASELDDVAAATAAVVAGLGARRFRR